MKHPKIIVVGSSNTDMVVKSERLPGPGETVVGGDFVQVPGGKGANQAVAAARMGAKVTFIARVGADTFGDQAIEGYRSDGIVTDYIVRDPERSTGIALILVDANGENSISVASGANFALSVADVEAAAERIREADALVMQLETPMEAMIRAAEIAHGAGIHVILDPAPAPEEPLPEALLRNVTLIKPNLSEASRLTGIEVMDEATARMAASRLLALGPRAAIVTLGAFGSVVAEGGETTIIPSYAVEANDTTAAGDAYTGALACALSAGHSLVESVKLASMAGALAASRMGAQTSLPTLEEVRGFCELRNVAFPGG